MGGGWEGERRGAKGGREVGVGVEERKERGGKIKKGREGRGRERRQIISSWLSKGSTTLLHMSCYMYTVQRRPALGSCGLSTHNTLSTIQLVVHIYQHYTTPQHAHTHTYQQ